MANEVFANGREIACKAADGKSICAFPDVCFTPPQTPATPPGVPIPYPNTAFAKDTTKGSKTVRISNQEVMLKNKSHFKKSTGNEAGRAPKKGIVTSKITGKVYFTSWSPNVKVEGKNVVRHLDLTTHNHGSEPANTPPGPYIDTPAFDEEKCKAEKNKEKEICAQGNPDGSWKEMKDGKEVIKCSDACKNAKACVPIPKKDDKQKCCHPDNTGHHLIEDHWVKGNANFPMAQPGKGYDNAPCICVNPKRNTGTHLDMHKIQGVYEESFLPGGGRHIANHPSYGFTYGEGKEATLFAHRAIFGKCEEGCIEAELDKYYGNDNNRPLNKPKRRQPIGQKNRIQTIKTYGKKVTG
jgi:hypothetical protein